MISAFGVDHGSVSKGLRDKIDRRPEKMRRSATRRHVAMSNTELAGGAIVGASLPAAAWGVGKIKHPMAQKISGNMNLDSLKVPVGKVPSRGIPAKLIMGVGPLLPGSAGKVIRHPLTIAGAAAAFGGPVLYHNLKNQKAANAEYKSIKEDYRQSKKNTSA